MKSSRRSFLQKLLSVPARLVAAKAVGATAPVEDAAGEVELGACEVADDTKSLYFKTHPCPFLFKDRQCRYEGFRADSCDKTIETCRNKFDNVQNFGGMPLIQNDAHYVRFHGER